MRSLKPKPCCEVKIDNALLEDKIIKEFIYKSNSSFVIVENIKHADIYVTTEIVDTRKDLLQVLLTTAIKPISLDTASNIYPFQPFLYEDTKNLQDQGENLFLFIKTVAQLNNLPLIDNTMLRLC